MISTRKCSACVAISRWLVISVFLLIVTTASAVGVSNAADSKQANNFQMNGASNDDLRVSADHNSWYNGPNALCLRNEQTGK